MANAQILAPPTPHAFTKAQVPFQWSMAIEAPVRGELTSGRLRLTSMEYPEPSDARLQLTTCIRASAAAGQPSSLNCACGQLLRLWRGNRHSTRLGHTTRHRRQTPFDILTCLYFGEHIHLLPPRRLYNTLAFIIYLDHALGDLAWPSPQSPLADYQPAAPS